MGQEDKDYTWGLVARKLAGEASPDELVQLERLLRSNPGLHYPLQTIADLWNHSSPGEQKKAEQAFSRHLDRMQQLHVDYQDNKSPSEPPIPEPQLSESPADAEQAEPSVKPRRLSRRYSIAAAVLLLTAVTGIILYRPQMERPAIATTETPAGVSEVATHNGSRTNLFLPDGTRIWLNAGSRVTYDKNFGASTREINLTGEAFFDVAHNPGKPFIIHAARVDIKVLGTRFNVRSYPSDRTTETTLIRGSIEVAVKDRPSEKIILKPNEKLIVANDDSTLQRSAGAIHHAPPSELMTIRRPTYESITGTVVETAWVDDKFIFQDESFGTLAKEMERWYGVSIKFTSPEQEQLRFTGNFQKESIKQALDALQLTASFTYTIDENQIIIYNR
jgi:ferric-dicitrate binding protein FerR (iron transport regulator)